MELSTENVVDILRKEYDRWIKLLTEKEKFAIEKYSWNSFDRNNGKRSFLKDLIRCYEVSPQKKKGCWKIMQKL